MLLGIDVGGTFTDAVLLCEGTIYASAKTPTTHGRLLDGIALAIDQVLANIDVRDIERVSLSTTIVTNTLIEGRQDKAALILMPGPGVNISSLTPTEPVILSGYTDHRGRQVALPKRGELEDACRSLKKSTFYNAGVVAIAGKFSIRNPDMEVSVAKWVQELLKPEHISIGSEMSGMLNFLRRANSAYYNAAVWRSFQNFSKDIFQALRARGLSAPVHILKADGGTMPLDKAAQAPIETVFTGPAASVLGIMALADLPNGQVVSLDIGGTTTDIALWQDKTALLSPGGARINKFPTAVRSFWLRSVGVGGDSYVRREEGKLKVGPMRLGAAMSLGGKWPTVFDAVRFLKLSDYGETQGAAKAMSLLACANQSPEEVAKEIVDIASDLISQAIAEMLEERESAPVYRVEDIVKKIKFSPQKLIGVGGAADGLAQQVAKKLNIPCQIPPGAVMANAVGAAAAIPTTYITFRADTAEGYYTVPELLLKKQLQKSSFTIKEAWELAGRHLLERAAASGISPETINETERVAEEEFNIIRGFYTAGKIMTCKLQIRPGIIAKVKERQ